MYALIEETRRLRHQLAELADNPEWSLLVRYELLPQKPSPVWHRRFSQRMGRLLRVSGLNRSYYFRQRWCTDLQHTGGLSDARTLLIWAEGADPQQIREYCNGFQRLLMECEDLSPVLVTDVTDFTFYSRLGWLVEYLPELSGEGAPYQARKRRYLAWRYRDALVVPVAAGLLNPQEWQEMLHLNLDN